MENNEQNNFETTNNVNPVNNVEPTPEVKTEDIIMVAEPAARPAVEPTPAPVAPAPQPMPAPEVSSRPEPVVIPKGEKPKGNNKGVVTLLLILILIVLAVCGYFVYDKYVKDLITKPSTNETSGNPVNNNVPEPTPNVEPTNDEDVYETLSIDDESIGKNLTIRNIKHTTSDEYTHKYNFDVYLDNKLVVNYEISRYEQIENFLKVVGYMKDNDTGADYMVFTVGPRAATVFVIDGSGKIFYRRDGSGKPESFLIQETGEYVSPSTYKIAIDKNTSGLENVYSLLYYVLESDIEMEVKAVQIKSGEATESTYKTYTKDDLDSLTGR